MTVEYAIIGSGLAGVTVAKQLVAVGIRPTIIDCGKTLPKTQQQLKNQISQKAKPAWVNDFHFGLEKHSPINKKNKQIKKLAFGSDYYIGDAEEVYAKESSNCRGPSFSFAKGGLSNGWGAAVLAAEDTDLSAWPIKRCNLEKEYQAILNTLPYSSCADGLNQVFPTYSDECSPLSLTAGAGELLQRMEKKRAKINALSAIFGQARLLTNAKSHSKSCQYCGHCMTGCVYGAIYTADEEVDWLISSGEVNYWGGCFVEHIEETNASVNVLFVDKHGEHVTKTFDKVFVAAGAVNSTRLIMSAKAEYAKKAVMLSTTGFVLPALWHTKNPIEWPNTNTQPDIFLEFKEKTLSPHWIHSQISMENEYIFAKLGLLNQKNKIVHRLARRFAKNIFSVTCNLHSDVSMTYDLQLEKTARGLGKLIVTSNRATKAELAVKLSQKKVGKILRTIGCVPINSLLASSIGFSPNHVGGTLPMRREPKESFDTDIYGRPMGMKLVHVVDSSIFPSIPGTTIGLTIMANAARIVNHVIKSSY